MKDKQIPQTNSCGFCAANKTCLNRAKRKQGVECMHFTRPASVDAECVATAKTISGTKLIGLHSMEAVWIYRAIQDMIALCTQQAELINSLTDAMDRSEGIDKANGIEWDNLEAKCKSQAEKIEGLEKPLIAICNRCPVVVSLKKQIEELKGE